MDDLKQKAIDVLRQSGLWCSEESIKLIEKHDRLQDVVFPVGLKAAEMHLKATVQP